MTKSLHKFLEQEKSFVDILKPFFNKQGVIETFTNVVLLSLNLTV